jgi:hypothetical protein
LSNLLEELKDLFGAAFEKIQAERIIAFDLDHIIDFLKIIHFCSKALC